MTLDHRGDFDHNISRSHPNTISAHEIWCWLRCGAHFSRNGYRDCQGDFSGYLRGNRFKIRYIWTAFRHNSGASSAAARSSMCNLNVVHIATAALYSLVLNRTEPTDNKNNKKKRWWVVRINFALAEILFSCLERLVASKSLYKRRFIRMSNDKRTRMGL